MTERNGERAPERTYILTERQFLDAVLKGAMEIGILQSPLELERARVHRADNGGLVIHLWLAAATSSEVAFEPKELLRMLRQYEADLPGPVPSLKEIEAWGPGPMLIVSDWVRELHRQAHPIAGVTPPPLEHDPPDVLLKVKGEPPKAAKTRPARKRARVEKGSLADQHSHEAAAREAEEAQGE